MRAAVTGPAVRSSQRLELCIGDFRGFGRLEMHASPRSAALLVSLLPLECTALHARWSGEAVWAPLGSGLKLDPENAIARPLPGQVLLYAGVASEPELLIPYGVCAFASRAGPLAGNHVVTLEADASMLRDLGEAVLWNGAQPVRLTRID